jgi:hypothetical protein
MTLTELIAEYRRQAVDNADPPLVNDTQLTVLFNEAVEEACTRSPLLFDDSTTAVCEIDVVSGTAVYANDPSIVYIAHAYLVDSGDEQIPLILTDRDWLDNNVTGWRSTTGEPTHLNFDESRVQLFPEPEDDYTLQLEVYRVPLAAEKLGAGSGETLVTTPAIAAMHHRHLVSWVVAQVTSTPDAELFNTGQEEKHREKFKRYFGHTPTADRRRKGRENRAHRNQLWK